MAVLISLLRGINVTGHNRIKMKDLRELYEALDLEKVRTYLQSGNVVFNYEEPDKSALADTIEKGIKQTSGLEVKVLLRTAEELETIVNNNPFVRENNIESERLYITFLSSSPDSARLQTLPENKDKNDRFIISDEEIYLYCPDGYGKTKFSNDFFERKLKITATTRNWKTVNALLGIARN